MTPSSGTAPNWIQRIGAVATPHAVDTATAAGKLLLAPGSPRARAAAVPRREEDRDHRGKRELEAGVEDDAYGFHASSTTAASSSTCHGSRSRATSQAIEVARARDRRPDHRRLRADGEHVRADRGERRDVAHQRGSRGAHASTSMPPATARRSAPLTASRW